MSKCRIWYHPDGKVSVSHPDKRPEKKPDNMTMDEWALAQFNIIPVKAPQFAGLDFEDMDTSQIPQDRADRDRWRGTKATGIQIDNTVILRKDLERDLDAELAKATPNAIKALKLQRKLDKQEHD